MNILNQNQVFQKRMPEILDAFIEVYGKKNEELLREHEKKIIYTNYLFPEDALKYYNFIKNCKAIELAIKYLKKIKVLEPHYELRKSYQKLPERINKLTCKYLDKSLGYSTFKGNKKHNYGISSFNELVIPDAEQCLTDYYARTQRSEQIKYLNNLRDNRKPEITEENYDEFKTTEEYRELYKRIQNYLPIYEELNSEFTAYINEINYLKEYHDQEKEKEKQNYKLKMLYTYEEIRNLIPLNIRQKLEESFPNIEKRVDFLLSFDLNNKSFIEYYSSKCSNDLKNPNISSGEKRIIKTARLMFLEELGVNVNNANYKNYEELIEKEEIKRLIPSESLVNFIIKTKEDAKDIVKRNAIKNNIYFKISVKNILDATVTGILSSFIYLAEESHVENELFSTILKGYNCCYPVKKRSISSKSQTVPVLLLLITSNENAVVDYVFIHELIHAIEFNEHFPNGKTGFDILEENKKNPYNKKYRFFERLNETITDMIAEKIRKNLFKKGIYLAENKKITDTKIMKNRNSDNLLKIILYPLFDKVGQELLDARLTGEIESFTTLIGTTNFLDLNDIINKVDYLIQKEDLKKKLKNKDCQVPTVIEYYKQLARAKTIYEDIDNRLLEQRKTNNKEYKKSL